MITAITRPVSATFPQCALTHLAREPIDVARARAQHHEYLAALRGLGVGVIELPEAPDLPDAVFVEDTAVVLEALAVITRPGAASRRAEIEGMEAVLERRRRLARIEAPGTLDGGDVLRLGRRLFVGRTPRSDDEGIAQLARAVRSEGFEVIPVEVRGCLHLKSAVTEVGPELIVVNPDWVDPARFPGYRAIEVDPAEPGGANALRVRDRVIYPAHHPRTALRLEAAGCRLVPVTADEAAKAEGGVTCCSILLGDEA